MCRGHPYFRCSYFIASNRIQEEEENKKRGGKEKAKKKNE